MTGHYMYMHLQAHRCIVKMYLYLHAVVQLQEPIAVYINLTSKLLHKINIIL